jgi:hypothetical protein
VSGAPRDAINAPRHRAECNPADANTNSTLKDVEAAARSIDLPGFGPHGRDSSRTDRITAMARRPRSSTLETRTHRLKLAPRLKPYDFTTLAPGIALGYRRNNGAGTCVVRVSDGKGSNWTKGFAADTIARRGLIDIERVTVPNLVALPGRRS